MTFLESVAEEARRQADQLRKEHGLSPLAQPLPTPVVSPAQGPARQVASAPPRFDVNVDLSDDAIRSVVSKHRADITAIEQYGSREGAIANGYRFAPDNIVPWNKIAGPADARLFKERLAAEIMDQVARIKGGDVLSDQRVRQMVAQRARLLNEDPEAALGILQRAGAGARSMVANMETAYLVANRTLQDAYQIWGRVRFGQAGPEEVTQARQLMEIGAQMLGEARAMTAAIGRGLRRHRREFMPTPGDLALLQKFSDEQLADIFANTAGDPKLLAKVVTPSWAKRAHGAAAHLLINGPLWWWPTHTVNLAGNATLLAFRPMTKYVGSFLVGADGREIRRQAVKEWRYTVSAIDDGMAAAWRAFVAGDSIMAPHSTPWFDSAGAGTGAGAAALQALKPNNSLNNIIANAITYQGIRTGAMALTGGPTRALGAVDELMKTIRYRAVIQARAVAKAEDMGLSRDDTAAYVAKQLEEAFDDSGAALDFAALREAQIVTFNQPLDSAGVGAWIQQGANRFLPIRVIFRYVRTPINALRYGIKLTPGLNMLQREYRDALLGRSGSEARAHAIGEFAMGTLFMVAMANLASSERITGGGPSDPDTRKAWTDAGHRPYSFEWRGTDGKLRTAPFGRMDPIGLPLGIAADIHQIYAHPDLYEDENIIMALGVALSKNVLNKTYLVSLNSAIQAAREPDRSLARYAGREVGGALPFSSLLRGTNPDPYLRDARGFVDNIMASLPGLSEKLPPRRNPIGEPVIAQRGLFPEVSEEGLDTELTRIAEETGMGLTNPAPTRDGQDLREVTLEDGRNAYDRFQELAMQPPGFPRTLRDALTRLINTDAYAKAPDGEAAVAGTKLNMLGKVTRSYREAALQALRRESPAVRSALIQRRVDVRNAYLANRAGQAQRRPEGFMDFLRQFGGQ